MVGATGFEPATSSSQNWHSTKLSYAPTGAVFISQSHHHRNPEMPAALRPDQAAGTLRPRLAAMKPLDQCLLYGFVDSAYLDGRDPAELCRQLCDGGTDLVQLRAKDWPTLGAKLHKVRPAVAELTTQFDRVAAIQISRVHKAVEPTLV